MLARMSGTSPFIPYELGKYLLLAGMIWSIFRFNTTGKEGWLMLLCLIPSLFLDVSGQVNRSDVIFNIVGAVNVALVIIVFYRQKITVTQFSTILRLMVYPIIAVLSYTIIKSPSLNETEITLNSNVDFSGGFGSNQVSTFFGLGVLLIFICMINRWTFSGFFLLDALILFGFSFRGLLTFSRGGMLGAVLGVIVILFYLRLASSKERIRFKLPKIGKYVLPIILVTSMSFYVVDEFTGGLLSLRYQGETIGTQQGSKVKDLNSVTTGRFEIFMGDIDLWADHFLLGVGAGASTYIRETMTGTVAHVELSRLLAEHGLLGFIYFLILCLLGFRLLKAHPNPIIRGILVAFFLVAIYTTFHAAMRTFITPALLGLSLLTVKLPGAKSKSSTKKEPNTSKILVPLK